MTQERRLKLRLPNNASDQLCDEVEREMAKLEAAEQVVRATERIKIRDGQGSPQVNRGGMQMSDRFADNQYPYLDSEDRAFAQCFRLNEDQFLEMAGGLKKYTQFRLDRQQARGATMTALNGETLTFDVPRLPSSTEEAMGQITMPDLKPEEYARYLLKECMDKTEGIMGALRANRAFKAEAERATREKASQREAALSKLRQEAAHLHGWSPDSQSAKDWADRAYAERKLERFI